MPMATSISEFSIGLSSPMSGESYFTVETTESSTGGSGSMSIKRRQDLTIREELQEEVDNWLEGVI